MAAYKEAGLGHAINQHVKTVTRFAPSPNGNLHLGHAYSAILAHDLARVKGGEFLLRIEDIDGPRSRQAFAKNFRRDLEWLGLTWQEVPAQSLRLGAYADAARRLENMGWLYRCSCTRKAIQSLPPRLTEAGVSYPGSCKGSCYGPDSSYALRLDIDKALATYSDLVWTDEEVGSVLADPRAFGDVVLVRKDLPASYHLAVTLDDAVDGVTDVTRGDDLFAATHIHRLLQEMLDLPVPNWHHHPLILDDSGRKLAKSLNSPPLTDRRLAGEDGKALANQLREHHFSLGT